MLVTSAVLHLLGTLLSGFSPVGIFMLGPAIFYVLLAADKVWTAWIALVCMLCGSVGSGLEVLRGTPVPNSILTGIIAADLAAAVALIRALRSGSHLSNHDRASRSYPLLSAKWRALTCRWANVRPVRKAAGGPIRIGTGALPFWKRRLNLLLDAVKAWPHSSRRTILYAFKPCEGR